MIVYKKLSSLTSELGFSAKALYTLSNSIEEHYKSVKIPKRSKHPERFANSKEFKQKDECGESCDGGERGKDRECGETCDGGERGDVGEYGEGSEYRQLYVPDPFLMTVQRRINERLLAFEEISPYATAYRAGGSTRINAALHVGKPVILKLDIRHFFDHIIYPAIKENVFPYERYSVQNSILLTLLCTRKNALPQGAPTSPMISNIILREFDNIVGSRCEDVGISYTRYCDDMTFSGEFDPKETAAFVRNELGKRGFFLNDNKTGVARTGQKKIVTGIVVNEKMNVPVEYRRKIRQEIYYCMKHGVASHMERCGKGGSPAEYIRKLLGKVNYVLSVTPDDEEFKGYREWLKK